MAEVVTRSRPPPILTPGNAVLHVKKPTFQTSFSNAKSPPYVLHVVPTSFGYLFAGSDDTIKAFDQSLSLLATLPSKQKGISSFARGAGDASTAVFSCATDGTVVGWDTKDLSAPAFSFKSKTGAPYLVCSQSADLNCLAVGTALHHHDATIDLWDLRTLKLAHTWTEAHSDDITALSFHPTVPHLLLSASVDGLINTHDIRVASEDDSIMSTAQVGASVSQVGWVPLEGQSALPPRGVWSSTTIETVQLWDAEDFTLLAEFGDIREVALQPWRSDFLIGCYYDPALEGMCVITGTQKGEVAIINAKDPSNWVLERVLPSVGGRTLGGDGHADIVRCASANLKNGTLVTGGEDGQVCGWTL